MTESKITARCRTAIGSPPGGPNVFDCHCLKPTSVSRSCIAKYWISLQYTFYFHEPLHSEFDFFHHGDVFMRKTRQAAMALCGSAVATETCASKAPEALPF